ncbi:MAG: NosL family protein [Geobacteraceae bacterium GWC2_58_44]|nr:MAG: NosL family protein [Geobacteraceae bacterium GWC2_58_44]HBG06384.1 NosL family protein [Geobacter sp.]
MKRIALILLCICSLSAVSSFAADLADVGKHPSCKYCGMDRGKFAHSRVLIEYDDGTSSGACSLHCAAIDLANNIDRTPGRIAVADYYGKELIDAEKALWVLGGGQPGVMTAQAKWAFRDKPAADRFIRENGGAAAGFDQAMRAAYNDMYSDTKQIRERRKMKRSKTP